jgi:hypothetical protein
LTRDADESKLEPHMTYLVNELQCFRAIFLILTFSAYIRLVIERSSADYRSQSRMIM